MKFKIGDKVRVIDPNYQHYSQVGVIEDYYPHAVRSYYAVRFRKDKKSRVENKLETDLEFFEELKGLKETLKGLDPALKFDDNKPPMHLLDGSFLKEISNVLAFGAKKYGLWNFKKGHKQSKLISAAMRHITSFNEGEDLDEETKLSHLAHAACCLQFAFYNLKNKPENDDRYKSE